MTSLLWILYALIAIWLIKQTFAPSSRRVAAPENDIREEPSGIDCFQGAEHIPGNLMTVLRRPPDVGTNNLVTDSVAHTFAHILMEVLPRQPLEEQYRAPFDVQLSYALLTGRRQLYKVEILPDRFHDEVSRMLETILQPLPALPLEGGSLFMVWLFRINRHSSGSPAFPRPFAGLIDANSNDSWETQIEQRLAGAAAAIDNSAFVPEECQKILEMAPNNGHALWLLGALYRLHGQPELALDTYAKLLPLNGWQQVRLPRAEILVGLGQFADALIELDALLAAQPEFLPALVLRADTLRLLGDLPAAEQAADRALQLGPENSKAHLARALIDAALNNHQRAVEHATTAHSCEPADPIPLLFRAEQHAILGDLPAALADLEKLSAVAPGWLPALQVKAQVLFAGGNFEGAVKLLSEVLNHTRPEQLLLLRGRALASAGKLESACADFTEVLKLNGENGQALLHRAQVSFELNRLDEASADVADAISQNADPAELHYLCGLIALRQEQPAEAMEAFDQALAVNPVHPRALTQRGQLYLAQQDAESALRDFELAVKTYPDSAEAWCLRGEAKRLLGNTAEALEDFDEALSRDANFLGAYFGRAKACFDNGQARRALVEINTVVDHQPDWPEPRFFRANLFLKMGDAEPAIVDLQYLRLQTRANAWPTQMLEAQALLSCERYDEAIALCEKILESTPEFWMAWVWHGQARVFRDGLDSGDESFDRALELQPELGSFIAEQQELTAATCCQRREQFDEVIRITTQLLEEDENSIAALHHRGTAYWYSQQLVEAAEDFSAILQDHPELTFARSGRGQVLAELGDVDAALLDLNQAVTEYENAGSSTDLAYSLSGRALTAVAREQWDAADEDLDRSLLLAPGNAWSMYHRGLLHHGRRDSQSASWCFRLALALNDPALPPHKRAKAQAYVAGVARLDREGEAPAEPPACPL
jgi:tetratricopeptide (TPR) repeat protein